MTILDEDLTFRDVHCRLSCTSVRAVDRPASTAEVQAIVRDAARRRESLAIAGSRYAGGGQAVLSGGRLVDMRGMRRVGPVDARRGLVEVEAGVTWPALIDALLAAQAGDATVWSVRQKQTGADRLTVGGAVSANAHGRGLGMGPIVDDVEALTLVDADGAVRYCDRSGDSQLFALAIGGYGLLGVITKVVLRLAPRCKLAREVEVRDLAGVVAALEARRAEGCLYGDFQFSTDERAPGFMRRGVLASYRPVPPETPVPDDRRALSDDDWARLVHLGHVDRRAAYEAYIGHYLATHGQVYWSDELQLGSYLEGYHAEIDRRTGAATPGSEVITELFVPRDALEPFMDDVRGDFLADATPFVYGTIRLVERDGTSFLAWAREPWACVIFNLCVRHDAAGLERAAFRFRRLIDRAIARGGTFYLTYHRWATRAQLLACYPRMPDFLRLKWRYDPEQRFRSDWYDHVTALLGASR